MNGGSRIVDLRPVEPRASLVDPLIEEDIAASEPEQAPDLPQFELAQSDELLVGRDEPVQAKRGVARLIAPTLAIIALLGWIGVSAWLATPVIAQGLGAIALIELIAALCIPPALIGIIWLLAMRSSTAQASRFGATVRELRLEAASLERTIAIVSRQVENNRVALSKQTDALMHMGDGAAERLVAISNGMGHQIANADDQARKLAEAITTAQDRLAALLAALPEARTNMSGIAEAIENAGNTASSQAAALEAQVEALAECGRTADAIADGAAEKLAQHIARMETTSETAGQRLESVTAEMATSVDNLLDRTAGAVDEARKGISAQGEAMLAMLEANQAALNRVSSDSVEALAGRIESIEAVIDRIGARLNEQRETSGAMVAGIDADFAAVEARVAAFHTGGIERTQTLAASISALGGSADAMTEALRTGDGMAHKVIATAENLLVSLDAAAREIDETLPDALERLDSRIIASRKVVASAKPELLALVTAAESTHDAIEAIAQLIQGQRVTLDQLSTLLLNTLTTGRDKAEAIGESMDETITRTHDFAEQAAPRLIETLIRVRDTANAAADRARETLSSVIPQATLALEKASTDAVTRAIGNSVEDHVRSIAEATDAAVAAAARASERLTRQMVTIAETTSMVEARIEDARAEREKADSDGFARRASLLIEALNSSAIDITRSFSAEVADSAWAAYLKGDRGVFTRRAVRLLDNGEARDIARLHEEDLGFRDQVNRYIHDFEAMLRAVLAQREGATMSVALLSSDLGKLYVALAQAIERLRA